MKDSEIFEKLGELIDRHNYQFSKEEKEEICLNVLKTIGSDKLQAIGILIDKYENELEEIHTKICMDNF